MIFVVFLTVTTITIGLLVLFHTKFFAKLRVERLTGNINISPILEFLTVILYLYWMFSFLFRDKAYYLYLVGGFSIVIIVITLVYVLRDFIPGIGYRTIRKLKPGIKLEVNNKKVELRKLGLLRLYLLDDGGKHLVIPYSQISQFSYGGSKDRQEAYAYHFQFSVGDLENGQKNVVRIRRLLMNSMWIPVRTNPNVQLVQKKDAELLIEVYFSAISPKHAQIIEAQIQELVSAV